MIAMACRRVRQYHRVTQQDMARTLGITLNRYRRMEKGMTPLAFPVIKAIAARFSLPPASLVVLSESLRAHQPLPPIALSKPVQAVMDWHQQQKETA